MSEYPVLFSGSMVRAISQGKKTQDRRPIKGIGQPAEIFIVAADGSGDLKFLSRNGVSMSKWIKPPWQKGDFLYCRETFFCASGEPGEPIIHYRADASEEILDTAEFSGLWKPSIHMPKWAARIWLEVVSVRPERVSAISEEDAKAEGARFIDFGKDRWGNQLPGWRCDRDPVNSSDALGSARFAFANLWQSLYGSKYPWETAWSWRTEFMMVEGPRR